MYGWRTQPPLLLFEVLLVVADSFPLISAAVESELRVGDLQYAVQMSGEECNKNTRHIEELDMLKFKSLLKMLQLLRSPLVSTSQV